MKPTTIYFVQRTDGLIKIGITKNLKRRLPQISKAHGPLVVLRSERGGKSEEARLHLRLASFNQFGEWFAPVPEVLSAVADYVPSEAERPVQAVVPSASEKEHVEKARRHVKSAVLARQMREGQRRIDVRLRDLEATHSISAFTMNRIFLGKAKTITAGLAASLKAMALWEMEETVRVLKADLDAENERSA